MHLLKRCQKANFLLLKGGGAPIWDLFSSVPYLKAQMVQMVKKETENICAIQIEDCSFLKEGPEKRFC